MTAPRPQILVVDDETRIGEFLAALLRRSGYEPHVLTSGEDALAALSRRRYDLLITDLVMPGVGGAQVIRAAKKLYPDMPCVMVTGYATLDAATLAMKAGADDHIIKPFDVNQLRRVIERRLNQTGQTADCQRLLSDLRAADEQYKARRADAAQAARRRLAEARRSLEELEAQLAAARAEAEAAQAAVDAMDFDDVSHAAAQSAARELGWPSAAVFVRTGEESLQFAPAAKHNWPAAADLEAPRVADLVARCAQTGQARADHRLLPGLALAAAPVFDRDAVAAAVCVAAPAADARADASQLAVLQRVANAVAQPMLETRRLRQAQRECWRAAKQLVAALETRCEFRKNHAQRVARYAGLIAQAAGLADDEVRDIQRGALVQNIGEVALTPFILNKPAGLTEEELEALRRHPEAGERIADELEAIRRHKKTIRHHHERWDGSGYPDGLAGDEIPLDSRIISLADAFDAMTSDRPYRPAQSPDFAMDEINREAGAQFDPELAKACQEALRNLRLREQNEQENADPGEEDLI